MDAVGSEPTPPWAALDLLDEVFYLDTLKELSFKESLDQWRQGDLVCGVRLFWASSPGVDDLTRTEMVSHGDGGWSVARWEQSNDAEPGQHVPEAMAIITSQTCDVVATGPGSRHPTVQVSPLIDLGKITPERAAAVRAGRTVDMVLITNAPPGSEWAADLRISLPLSKSALVAQVPRRAFANAHEEYVFAERVAMKTRRPAVHDAAVDLAKGLNELVKQGRKDGSTWVDRVEQVRARAKEGTLLKPDALELIVITLDGRLSAEQMDPLRNWRNAERKRFKSETNGGLLTPLRFVELEKMKVQDYRESVPLALSELGQPPFW